MPDYRKKKRNRVSKLPAVPAADLERLRGDLKTGGEARYRALVALVGRVKAGEEIADLIPELASAALDLDMGTYHKAYEVFGELVNANHSIEKALPALVMRAEDTYRSGQQVRWILLRYAEKTTANADQVFAEVERSLLGPKKIKTKDDFPQWVRQLKALQKKSVVAQTLSWGDKGVLIRSGELSWFGAGTGGYSQTYLDFLENGPKGLWIDRAMPESTRLKLYAVLGAEAPVVKLIPEKRAEVENVFLSWEKKFGRGGGECAECKPRLDLLRLGEEKIQGCATCGQLYHHTVEHYHDAMEPNEDIEMTEKCEFDTIRKKILSRVEENEAYEIVGEV